MNLREKFEDLSTNTEDTPSTIAQDTITKIKEVVNYTVVNDRGYTYYPSIKINITDGNALLDTCNVTIPIDFLSKDQCIDIINIHSKQWLSDYGSSEMEHYKKNIKMAIDHYFNKKTKKNTNGNND